MFKKILGKMFGTGTAVVEQKSKNVPDEESGRQLRTAVSIPPPSAEEYKVKAREIYNQARQVYDLGDIRESIKLINKSNDMTIRSMVKTKEEYQRAKMFFGVNEAGYKEAKKLKLPIRGIPKIELDQIHHEVCWYALNNIKPGYALMAFLMFKDYYWPAFDEELTRIKAAKQPEEYELYYFIKNEPKTTIEMSSYRESFYQLTLDARILLSSYNAIGRKRKIKPEDVEMFWRHEASIEIKEAGYVYETQEGLVFEFPVAASKQVMWEKKKLETLLGYMLTLVYRKREYVDAKNRNDGSSYEDAHFLVNGTGGSTLCKTEALLLPNTKEDGLPPHAVGCKCSIHFVRTRTLLPESEQIRYNLK